MTKAGSFVSHAIVCALALAGCSVTAAPITPSQNQTAPSVVYPEARRVNLTENYFGTPVEDPYRWLEDPFSKETATFSQQQNKLALSVLETFPDREAFRKAFREINAFDRIGTPFKEGSYYYYFLNPRGANPQSQLYRSKTLQNPNPDLFLDPNTLSPNGVDRVDSYSFSPDGKKFAYIVTKNETDYAWIGFVDVDSKKPFDTLLRYAVRSNDEADFKWAKDGSGVAYTRYKAPAGLSWDDAGRNNDLFPYEQTVLFHRFGAPVESDTVCESIEDCGAPSFAPVEKKDKFIEVDDGKGGIIRVKVPAKKNRVFTPWTTFLPDQDLSSSSPRGDPASFDTTFIGTSNGTSYFQTAAGASRYKIIAIPEIADQVVRAIDCVPEEQNLVLDKSFLIADGVFALFYLDDVKHVIRIVKGTPANPTKILYTFPYHYGAANDIKADKDLGTITFRYETLINPGTIYIYSLSTNRATTFRKLVAPAATQGLTMDQVFFPSKDGTRVPSFVVRPRNAQRNGANRIWMYGYGGFQSNSLPTFNAFAVALARHYGGFWALINLRGGSEYGFEWYKGGSNLAKQNCYDDVIWAGKYFVKEGWTKEGLLSIHGGSNGGLLAGAVSLQAPALIGAGIADYGVHETLRYTNFTYGPGWQDDYGRKENATEVLSVLKWAPVYNIKPGTRYPAMLITTGDHDTRVSPLHSYKFAAGLQHALEGVADAKPVLLRVRELSGHNIFSLHRYMDTYTDKVTFWAKALGATFRP